MVTLDKLKSEISDLEDSIERTTLIRKIVDSLQHTRYELRIDLNGYRYIITPQNNDKKYKMRVYNNRESNNFRLVIDDEVEIILDIKNPEFFENIKKEFNQAIKMMSRKETLEEQYNELLQ